MALPTLERNWIFTRSGGVSSLNQIIPYVTENLIPGGTSVAQCQRLVPLWYLKDTLVNFSSGPWTVVQSKISNGTYGNTDYWTDARTALFAGTSGAWIVLQNTFAGRTAQILISTDFWNNSGVVYSTTGTLFPASVSGAVPILPSDALRWASAYSDTGTSQLLTGSIVPRIHRINVMQTWDAIQGVESLRFVMYSVTSRLLWGFWDKIKDVPTGGTVWNYPEVALWGPNYNYNPQYSGGYYGGMSYWKSVHFIHNTTMMGARLSCEATQTENPIPHNVYGVSENMLGGYVASQIGLVGDTSPMRGKIGNLVDFWLGSNYVSDGEYFDVGSSRFFQMGQFIWPFDNTKTPQLT